MTWRISRQNFDRNVCNSSSCTMIHYWLIHWAPLSLVSVHLRMSTKPRFYQLIILKENLDWLWARLPFQENQCCWHLQPKKTFDAVPCDLMAQSLQLSQAEHVRLLLQTPYFTSWHYRSTLFGLKIKLWLTSLRCCLSVPKRFFSSSEISSWLNLLIKLFTWSDLCKYWSWLPSMLILPFWLINFSVWWF